MSTPTCHRCALLLQRAHHLLPTSQTRRFIDTRSPQNPNSLPLSPKPPLDIAATLSKPTWSIRSLLPPATPEKEITPKQLRHLLRLSALPSPTSPEQEAAMLETLHAQLHFVRDIQGVDTRGVEPLQSIRDETVEGREESSIGVEELREALEAEEIVGRNRRLRRKPGRGVKVDTKGVEDWDVLGTAGEVVENGLGRFFVVRSGKEEVVEKEKKKGA